MNSLDDKLKEILKVSNENITYVVAGKIVVPDFVEYIKQAFVDEGYLTPEQKEQVQEALNQSVQNAQELMKLPMTVHKPDWITGQEWYDRFEIDIYKEIPFPGENQHESQLVGKVLAKVYEAAKRAAGLKT